ncbi:hypothetical protein FJ973_05790 [Mesorhizobium sp. B2-1-3]|uniref:hypothetical protein n=1 Tax=Mesorhizobium sp. B2-1-3 TaxID=2589972 RepID=UPI001125F85F|nr:hypothetical protein [Mesorhizobium sp. B2-1-3]TPN16201.1 hypothetical protein FJ973_05790 [Mesorhizobium sp. B2-1-3]
MAQASKKPVAAKPAARKTASPHAARGADQTEMPEATIKRLAEEAKKFSDWWHEDRRNLERLQHRVRSLEGTLRAISNLALLDVGDFVKRCDRSSPYDDNIPF